MLKKQRYEYWWFRVLEPIAMLPIMFSVFPIPLALPGIIIAMCIDQPEETPLAIIFFSWLILGIIFLAIVESKDNH